MPAPTRKQTGSPRSRSRLGWIIAVLAVFALAGWWWHARSQPDADAYRTAVVERGTIAVSISATGSLSAISTVDVGSQVSGIVTAVLVDFNDHVNKGQVIARIDPSTFNARVQQYGGAVSAARAQLAQAEATLRNTQVDYSRKSDLGSRQLVARSDVDAARALRDASVASVAGARAQITQQQANVDSAQLDLSRSVIRAPVDGVVLTRAVEPGQTVAASLQTPTLFQIAEDLRQMQIVLAVDEADIGQLKVGQRVKFTVDAFPDRNFSGTVKQVRLSATNTQNVITYPVVVTVDNDDLSLLPGMTVNAEIQISRLENVLKIPNAALRFRLPEANGGSAAAASPSSGSERSSGMLEQLPVIAAQLHLDASQQALFDKTLAGIRQRAQDMRKQREQAQAAGSSSASLFGHRPPGSGSASGRGGASPSAPGSRMLARIVPQFAAFRASLQPAQQQSWDTALKGLSGEKRATIYTLVGGKPQSVNVVVGASDGTMTQVSGASLKEGDKVVIGTALAAPPGS